MYRDVGPYFGTGNYLDKQQIRQLAAVEHGNAIAEAQVEGINRVTQRAMVGTLRTHEIKKYAEAVAPDGAELYAMIAVAGAVESVKVINDINRRWWGGWR